MLKIRVSKMWWKITHSKLQSDLLGANELASERHMSIQLRNLKSYINPLLFIAAEPASEKCYLSHWGRVKHVCIRKLIIIGTDNGLSPGRRQAIIWTNAGILLIGPLGTNFGEILIEIYTFSFKKMHLKMSSAKWRPFCPILNVLKQCCFLDNSAL